MSKHAVDYIALALYQKECAALNTIGVRWWCMRTDMKTKYRRQARDLVAIWLQDEEATEKRNRFPMGKTDEQK